jgi:hypothetical protein
VSALLWGGGATGFSSLVPVVGSGSSLTSERGLAAGDAGIGIDSGAAIRSDVTVIGAGRSHQNRTAPRRTAFSMSAASTRPEA